VPNIFEIYFYPPEHNRSLHGVLSAYTNVSVSAEEWPQAVTNAWQDHADESKSEQLTPIPPG
jgi:hypothetical protein